MGVISGVVFGFWEIGVLEGQGLWGTSSISQWVVFAVVV